MAGSIVVIKEFNYRGTPEEWSNRYHFQGSAPTTPSGWRALCDAFITEEKAILTSLVTIKRVLCYTADGSVTAYSYDLAAFAGVVVGTFSLSGVTAEEVPGDTAYLIRWNTGRLSSRGKPVYLFKYYHGGATNGPGHSDEVLGTLKIAMGSFASGVIASSGSWPGLADKTGTAPVGYLAETYLTTRTLKRRGRRPT